jgi:protein tyrosine phosphatase (PTP) superfamily phosphohydrolase (DUF442 family)
MENILNYIKINENISTSGQPSVEQFELISKCGYEVVINLALHDASNAIESEDEIVTRLGLSYFHIPVIFDNPTEEQLRLFLDLLSMNEDRKVWVHCALNYRVSAFMYIFHKYYLQTPFDDIDLSLLEQWKPSPKWQDLMKIELE